MQKRHKLSQSLDVLPQSCFYFGSVTHQRLIPFRHGFRYRVFTSLIDLDELSELPQRLKWLSFNRFGLFSIYNKDHGARDGSEIKPWVLQHLAQKKIQADKIFMLSVPRIWGYVFNPLTIYYAYHQNRLVGIVYEVKNTFGGQHAYVTPIKSQSDLSDHPHRKKFYVSPFIPMEGGYHFRVKPPLEKLSICIRQDIEAGEVLIATQTGQRLAMTDKNILKLFFRFPFIVFKIIFGIHWQALKLWSKGAVFYKRDKVKS